jgi:hypothetical protein
MRFQLTGADELPVHNRKGVGNQKEKGGGVSGKLKPEGLIEEAEQAGSSEKIRSP